MFSSGNLVEKFSVQSAMALLFSEGTQSNKKKVYWSLNRRIIQHCVKINFSSINGWKPQLTLVSHSGYR